MANPNLNSDKEILSAAEKEFENNISAYKWGYLASEQIIPIPELPLLPINHGRFVVYEL